MKRLLFLVSIAVVLVGFTASATTVTYTSWVAAPAVYTTTTLDGTFTLPQYNGAGTLSSVSLTYTLYWQNVTASVTNNALPGDEDGTYRVQGQLSSGLTGATISALDFTSVLFHDPAAWYPGGLPINVAPQQTINIVIASPSGTDSTNPTITAPLSAFTGGGNLTYLLEVRNSSLNELVGGAMVYDQTAQALGELQITYNDDVPEPATAAVGGLGLLALGFLGRRFARR